MIKKLIGAVALMMLTCTATFAAEGGFPLEKARTASMTSPRCKMGPSCSSTTV